MAKVTVTEAAKLAGIARQHLYRGQLTKRKKSYAKTITAVITPIFKRSLCPLEVYPKLASAPVARKRQNKV